MQKTQQLASEQHSEKAVCQSKYLGCFYGLALGDTLGAPHEGGYVEQIAWRLFGKTRDGKRRFTDDTQMAIDIAHTYLSFTASSNSTNDAYASQSFQDTLANAFANSYRWSRGYGPSAAALLKGIRSGKHWSSMNRKKYPEGSYGNGAAMRAPLIALCFPLQSWDEVSIQELLQHVTHVSEITHAHPEAIEGAFIIALSVAYGLPQAGQTHSGGNVPSEKKTMLELLPLLEKHIKNPVLRLKLETCKSMLTQQTPATPSDVARHLGNRISARESCVTAVYLALAHEHNSFSALMDFAIRVGGDVDTIAAMSGAIWGSIHGINKLPTHEINQIESKDEISMLAEKLHAIKAAQHSQTSAAPEPC